MSKMSFPGLLEPTTDFQAVRDGRRSSLFYYDVDLSVARSITASPVSALLLPISGNSFYIDQDTNTVGYARVHFQDTNYGSAPAPVYVGPGFIANVPFTQLLIENTAQPGKILRIFYGVDIDFAPGVNAQVAITGNISVQPAGAPSTSLGLSVTPYGVIYQSSYKGESLLAANTPEQVFSAASNVNGAIVWSAEFIHSATSLSNGATFVAKNSGPTSIIDGDVIVSPTMIYPGATETFGGSLKNAVRIAAGKGLYFLNEVAATRSMRSCLYTLL
jgi:hypothetical protein